MQNKHLLRKTMNLMLKHIFLFLLFFPPPPTDDLRSTPVWDWESTLFKAFWTSLDLSCNRQRATRRDWVRWKGQCLWFQPLHLPSVWCACEKLLLVAATPRDKMQTKQIIHFQGLLTEREIYLWNIYCSVSGENHVIIARGKAWKVLYFA